MGHAPSKIPQISTIFKIISPPLATSHGGGALVDMVVRGGGSPGVKPAGFSSHRICDMVYFDI
jgi:hypothetical protein